MKKILRIVVAIIAGFIIINFSSCKKSGAIEPEYVTADKMLKIPNGISIKTDENKHVRELDIKTEMRDGRIKSEVDVEIILLMEALGYFSDFIKFVVDKDKNGETVGHHSTLNLGSLCFSCSRSRTKSRKGDSENAGKKEIIMKLSDIDGKELCNYHYRKHYLRKKNGSPKAVEVDETIQKDMKDIKEFLSLLSANGMNINVMKKFISKETDKDGSHKIVMLFKIVIPDTVKGENQ